MRIAPNDATVASATALDRRHQARLQLAGELQGTLIPDQTLLRVLDVSEDGFAVESPVPFTPGREYRVRFSTVQKQHGILRAVNVHCLHATLSSRATCFAGFQFREKDEAVAIRAMIADVESLREKTART